MPSRQGTKLLFSESSLFLRTVVLEGGGGERERKRKRERQRTVATPQTTELVSVASSSTCFSTAVSAAPNCRGHFESHPAFHRSLSLPVSVAFIVPALPMCVWLASVVTANWRVLFRLPSNPGIQAQCGPRDRGCGGSLCGLGPRGLCFTGNQNCFCFPKVFESGGILEPRGIRKMWLVSENNRLCREGKGRLPWTVIRGGKQGFLTGCVKQTKKGLQ